MTDPKIIAELRELLGQYAMRIEDSDGDSCCFCGDSFSVDHRKEDCGFCHACASDHMANDVMPVLASLLADSERLRIAAEGLGKISTYDDDGTWGNARIKDIAREYLAKIKETE